MTSLHGLVRLLPLTITASVALISPGYGQQLPNVVTSDIYNNTAMGTGALLNLTPFQPSKGYGEGNTAAGAEALENNTSGYQNTALGNLALGANTTGSTNTAFGAFALGGNQTGESNTATGYEALEQNTTGSNNTADGLSALTSNLTGNYNTASGWGALGLNVTGNNNTASGYDALLGNTAGNYNTAMGSASMYYNQTGSENTAVGHNALGSNRGGSNNIAIGSNAGYDVRGGRNNIEIGNTGTASDAGTIRIGTPSQQSATYIAGITDAHIAGSAVYISPTGQLGVLASSERYKSNVVSMGPSSENLKKLRPVTFRLKRDPKAGVQYGLIAEEVAKVYPELVIRGDKGQIEGIRYEELTPMLLNEIQRQQAQLRDMQQQLAKLQEFRRSMEERISNH